ncbi:MAG: OB-fold nucleic acid binding domain-containing protein [Candidatus Aenigmatarchaeota archaeon]
MDLNELMKRIIEKTGSSSEDVQKKIIEKQRELSNLVSKEGAAYIIAKELGLDVLPKQPARRLEIKNIVPKIRDLKVTGRIIRIFEPKEFKGKDGKKGKVASLILGDETGNIRLSLWDDQTDILERVKPGMAIEAFGTYTKENGVGGLELRIGNKGGIKLLENSELPEFDKLQSHAENGRTNIADLKEGENAELRASIVQLFETSVFYEICPQCGSRVTKEAGEFKCTEHGKVTPVKTIVLSGIIDDGTGNIRIVFFRDVALELVGMDIKKALENEGSFFESINILGKEFIISGKTRRNKMFNRLEFVANGVREVDPITESKKIINMLESKV